MLVFSKQLHVVLKKVLESFLGRLLLVLLSFFLHVTLRPLMAQGKLSSDECSPPAPKRAKHDSGQSTSGNTDVDAEVDEMINSTPKVSVLDASEHDVLGSIAQEYDLDEQCSEEVNPKLTAIVNKMVRSKLNDDKLKEKLSQCTRPANCENISGTKVNPEIWPKIKPGTRSRDIKLQRLQNILAMVPLVKVTNTLMLPHSKLPDSATSVIKTLIDSVALLGHANCELVQRRRDLIRPALNNQFQQICGEHVEFTELLFGNDLPKQIHDISATNRVGQKLATFAMRPGVTHSNKHYSRNNYRPGSSSHHFRQKPPQKGKKFYKDSPKQI